VDPGDRFVADVSGASGLSNEDRAEPESAVAGAEIVFRKVVGP
jgi:hypothetical protein